MQPQLISLLTLSAVCLLGLLVFGRRALRSNGFLAVGMKTDATVRDRQVLEPAVGGRKRFRVSYAFVDELGNDVTHSEEFSDETRFSRLKEGQTFPIVYLEAPRPVSQPLTRVRKRRRHATALSAVFLIGWIAGSVALTSF